MGQGRKEKLYGAICIVESVSQTNARRCIKYGQNEIPRLEDGLGHKETHKPEKVYHEGRKDHRNGDQRNKDGIARSSKKSPK